MIEIDSLLLNFVLLFIDFSCLIAALKWIWVLKII